MNFDALFFDIDGTLLEQTPLMPEGIRMAFEDIGYKIENVPWRGNGMTDYQIVRLFLDDYDLSDERKIELAEQISQLIPEKVFAGLEKTELHACPGILELIEALKEKQVPIGLLTGNMKIITAPKLRKVGLDPDDFKFGGFGDHSPVRSETARRALESASIFIGKPLEPQRSLVIGDTPNDIACAQAVGAKSMGVATGKFSIQKLLDAGADYALPDLTDRDKFFEILGL